MTHWTDFLAFAVCHQFAMQFTQISIDPMQLSQAMQQAAQQARQLSPIMSGQFDPRLLRAG